MALSHGRSRGMHLGIPMVQGLERRSLAESREDETYTHMALPSKMSFTSHYKG